jgi:tetratricopeptide (TPR) repeat protein
MKTLTYFMWLFILLILIGVGFWILNQKLGNKPNNYTDIYEQYSKPCLNYWTTDTGYKDTGSMAFLAMVYYEQKNYSMALEAFKRYEPKKEEEAFYNFYIGLCYLYTDFNNLAINHLKIASETFKEFSLIHLSRWYLGLAYLKSNMEKEAAIEFEEIVKMNAQHRTQAAEILGKMGSGKNPFKFITGLNSLVN